MFVKVWYLEGVGVCDLVGVREGVGGEGGSDKACNFIRITLILDILANGEAMALIL